MARALSSRNSDTSEQESGEYDLSNNRQEQIRLSSLLAWVLPGIIVKITACYQDNSNLSLPSGSRIWVSFSSEEWGNLIFRCGSSLRFSAPRDFIEWLNTDSIDTLDFLILEWQLSFNGQTIEQELWNDNPYLHSGKRLWLVPELTREILDGIRSDNITPSLEIQDEIARRKSFAMLVRSGIGSAVQKLLPPKIHESEILEFTPKWVGKLRQETMIKLPRIEITKRQIPEIESSEG